MKYSSSEREAVIALLYDQTRTDSHQYRISPDHNTKFDSYCCLFVAIDGVRLPGDGLEWRKHDELVESNGLSGVRFSTRKSPVKIRKHVWQLSQFGDRSVVVYAMGKSSAAPVDLGRLLVPPPPFLRITASIPMDAPADAIMWPAADLLPPADPMDAPADAILWPAADLLPPVDPEDTSGDLLIAGRVIASGFLTWSDARLKEDITSLDTAAVRSKLSRIGAYTYRYRAELGAGDATHIGLLAQEVQKQFPELVATQPDGALAVNYVELIPVLMHCVNELGVELAELHQRPEPLASQSELSVAVLSLFNKCVAATISSSAIRDRMARSDALKMKLVSVQERQRQRCSLDTDRMLLQNCETLLAHRREQLLRQAGASAAVRALTQRSIAKLEAEAATLQKALLAVAQPIDDDVDAEEVQTALATCERELQAEQVMHKTLCQQYPVLGELIASQRDVTVLNRIQTVCLDTSLDLHALFEQIRQVLQS